MDINNLLRENIRTLAPYSSARSEYQGRASVWLDANENALAENGLLNRYPDPNQAELKQLIGAVKEIAAANIFLGNGSDEAIDLLIRAFCEPGRDNIVIFPPTYGMYKVAAAINNVTVREVPLNDQLQPDVAAALRMADEHTKILFLCSPNNPTGNLIDRDTILSIIKEAPGLVVIDEAYIDFAAAGSSGLPLLQQYPNLVILQTFSKAWGMAALRLGMAFASTAIIDILNKIKPPYNINQATEQLVKLALQQKGQVQSWVEKIILLRQELFLRLSSLRCVVHVFPSDANFLLVKVPDADRLYNFLLYKGIVVRNRTGQQGCAGCLRITIGTPQEQALLLAAMDEYEHKEYNNITAI